MDIYVEKLYFILQNYALQYQISVQETWYDEMLNKIHSAWRSEERMSAYARVLERKQWPTQVS